MRDHQRAIEAQKQSQKHENTFFFTSVITVVASTILTLSLIGSKSYASPVGQVFHFQIQWPCKNLMGGGDNAINSVYSY